MKLYDDKKRSEILEEFKKSGKTAYGFCKEKKLSLVTLKRWLSKENSETFGIIYKKDKLEESIRKNETMTCATIFKNDKISIELEKGYDRNFFKKVIEMILND